MADEPTEADDPRDEERDESNDDSPQDDPLSNPDNPLARLLSQLGLGGDGTTGDLASLLADIQRTMNQFSAQMASFGPAGGEDGANWGFAKDIARKTVAQRGADPSCSDTDVREVADAVALANLWLDQVTTFPPLPDPGRAWSRAEWIEHTFVVWQRLVGPIVTSISEALVQITRQPDGEVEPLQAMLQPMMRSAAAGMFGAQVGHSIGSLAGVVLSGTDVSLPVTPAPTIALIPVNLAEFGDGLDQPLADVRLYLALREVARQRLFGAVGWLAPQMLALVEHYAREITIDPSGLETALESSLSGGETPDMAQLEALGRDFATRLFKPDKSPEQIEILGRLETLLALVEGWVDDVVTQAVSTLMPSSAVLGEVLRRRRAAGGPAEQALNTLVGLELRPRRIRDAVNLWAAVRSVRGAHARDESWAHPDLAPTAADLDDPLGYAEHGHVTEPDSFDAELARLLDESPEDPPRG
jgi:putative hydrolase